jgi:hypothetical protein
MTKVYNRCEDWQQGVRSGSRTASLDERKAHTSRAQVTEFSIKGTWISYNLKAVSHDICHFDVFSLDIEIISCFELHFQRPRRHGQNLFPIILLIAQIISRRNPFVRCKWY